MPLFLGGLAILNPFIGLILMLVFCSYGLRNGMRSPFGSLLLFFVFPVIAALMSLQMPGMVVMASDAVWGVGFATLLFLNALRNGQSLNTAFTQAAILIILYGTARFFLFGSYLHLANEQTIADLNKYFPQLYGNQDMQSSLALLRYTWPASWTVPQIASLFLGFLILRKITGAKLSWRELQFPGYYNLFVICSLPLYLMPAMQQVFVNALIALLVLPMIQGAGLFLHFLSRYVTNKFVLALLMLILISNIILVILLGFADIWLDFRKLNTKGTNV